MDRHSLRSCILLVVASLSAAAVVTLSFIHWTFGFNSDYILVGLQAKRFLEGGELPIFLYRHGYLGVLPEASAIALSFKLFGISARTLFLPNELIYLLMLAATYCALRPSLDRGLAALSVLLVVLASPWFCCTVLRPNPNCGEIYLTAMGATALYLRLVRELYVEREAWRLRHDLALCLLGALCGFGLYLYGPFIFFPTALVGHAALPVIRSRFGVGWRKIFRALAALGGGAVLGLSPQLYYRFILGRALSVNRFLVGGSLEEILHRVGIAARVIVVICGWDARYPWSALAPVLILACTAYLCTHHLPSLWRWLQGTGDRARILAFSPLCLLPLAAIPAFLISRRVSNFDHGRYLLSLHFFFALVSAKVIAESWRAIDRAERIGATIALVALLACRGEILRRAIAGSPEHAPAEAVIQYLDEQGITRAYGDFWRAYTVSFLTRERILVEPTYCNYHPDYGRPVAEAERIAYLARPDESPVDEQGTVPIGSLRYHVEAEAVRGDTRIFVLRKPPVGARPVAPPHAPCEDMVSG